MQPLTGVVLVELIGRDVLTWRVTPDPLQELIYSIDTAEVAGAAILDLQGPITDVTLIRSVAARKTIIQFRKRSAFYAILYRRNNFIDERGGEYAYTDFWRFQGERHYAWLFPPGSRVLALLPLSLQPYLGQAAGQPVIVQRIGSLTIEARYRLNPPAPAPPLAEVSVDLPALFRQLAPPHGAEAETLRRATAQLAGVDALLQGATAMRRLLTGEEGGTG